MRPCETEKLSSLLAVLLPARPPLFSLFSFFCSLLLFCLSPLPLREAFSSCCPLLADQIRAPDQRGWLGSSAQAGRCRFLLSPRARCFLFSHLTPTHPQDEQAPACHPSAIPILHPILDEPLCWYECRIVSDLWRLSLTARYRPVESILCINCVECSPELLHALYLLPQYLHARHLVRVLHTYLLLPPNTQH